MWLELSALQGHYQQAQSEYCDRPKPPRVCAITQWTGGWLRYHPGKAAQAAATRFTCYTAVEL